MDQPKSKSTRVKKRKEEPTRVKRKDTYSQAETNTSSNRQSKKFSLYKLAKKKETYIEEEATNFLRMISLITTTTSILTVLLAMQVVTISQVKTLFTILIKGLLTALFINNASKIVVLIPTLFQPIQVIQIMLVIKEAVTSQSQ